MAGDVYIPRVHCDKAHVGSPLSRLRFVQNKSDSGWPIIWAKYNRDTVERHIFWMQGGLNSFLPQQIKQPPDTKTR